MSIIKEFTYWYDVIRDNDIRKSERRGLLRDWEEVWSSLSAFFYLILLKLICTHFINMHNLLHVHDLAVLRAERSRCPASYFIISVWDCAALGYISTDSSILSFIFSVSFRIFLLKKIRE